MKKSKTEFTIEVGDIFKASNVADLYFIIIGFDDILEDLHATCRLSDSIDNIICECTSDSKSDVDMMSHISKIRVADLIRCDYCGFSVDVKRAYGTVYDSLESEQILEPSLHSETFVSSLTNTIINLNDKFEKISEKVSIILNEISSNMKKDEVEIKIKSPEICPRCGEKFLFQTDDKNKNKGILLTDMEHIGLLKVKYFTHYHCYTCGNKWKTEKI